jgi:hypothetical protein
MDTEQLCGLHTNACIQNLAASLFQKRTKELFIMIEISTGENQN